MGPAPAGSQPSGYAPCPRRDSRAAQQHGAGIPPVNATRANGGNRGGNRAHPCDHRAKRPPPTDGTGPDAGWPAHAGSRPGG